MFRCRVLPKKIANLGLIPSCRSILEWHSKKLGRFEISISIRLTLFLILTHNDFKHNFELGIIEKYSPFSSRDDLIDYFENIQGRSGTIVILYNLQLVNGETELDIETDPHDIRMRDFRYIPEDRK